MISPQYVDGLELRIEELASELRSHKAALAGLQQERDALAAHVDGMERRGDQMAIELRDWLGSYGPDDETERMLEVWEEAKSRRPEASLTRLKAEWQAEAVVEFGYRYGPESEVRAAIQSVANELRRQAEEE